jgi:hypothetical protein
MNPPERKSSIVDREAMARQEMDATRVSPGTARALVALFLGLIALGLVAQAFDRRVPRTRRERVPIPKLTPAVLQATVEREGLFAANRKVVSLVRAIDTWSEHEATLGRLVRVPVQWLLLRAARYGNGQTRVGRGEWLFWEPEIAALTGPPFLDPRSGFRGTSPGALAAVERLAADLRSRGIGLLLLPTPAKVSVEIRRLRFVGDSPRLVRNPSYAEFARRAEAAGAAVFDPLPRLEAEAATGRPMFLRFDSHWRPETVDLVAQLLAEELRRRYGIEAPAAPLYYRSPREVTGRPDLVELLGFRYVNRFARFFEPVTVQVVHSMDRKIFVPKRRHEAPVLLLGDSMSGYYGWTGPYGYGAGLAEQLAFHLQTEVDAILEAGGGRYDAREVLASRFLDGENPLANRRVVVLEFGERELSIGAWNPAPLPAP